MTTERFKVPFMDLRLDASERQRCLNAIDVVFQHGRLILGPEVEKLEQELALRLGRRYVVGVGSGSDALLLSLLSLNVGHGDEVITTPLSFVATANAIAMTGARPVFVDIGDDLNINSQKIEAAVTSATKAVIPVHYGGYIADMAMIDDIASRQGIHIIEDAAQAFDAMRFNQMAGTWGILACFSMNPMKVFGAVGESGIVVTDNSDLYQKLIALRYNGLVNKRECNHIGINGRIDTLQAAVLLDRLQYVENKIRRRTQIAEYYDENLTDYIQVPTRVCEINTYYSYTIISRWSFELHNFLMERYIETQFPQPLIPDMPAYKAYGSVDINNARRLCPMLLNLPCNEKLEDWQVELVVEGVKDFFCNIQGVANK